MRVEPLLQQLLGAAGSPAMHWLHRRASWSISVLEMLFGSGHIGAAEGVLAGVDGNFPQGVPVAPAGSSGVGARRTKKRLGETLCRIKP